MREKVVLGRRTRIGGLRYQTELAHVRHVLVCVAICCCQRLVELAIDKGTGFAARYRVQRYGRVLDLKCATRRGGLKREDTRDQHAHKISCTETKGLPLDYVERAACTVLLG